MQELRLSALRISDGLQHSIPQSVRPLFTPRRLAYSLAGAFLAIGVASMPSSATDQQPNDATAQNLTSPDGGAADTGPPTSDTAGSGSSVHNTTNFSSTTINGKTSTSLQVNGQDIPLPEDGTYRQTIVDGSATTTIKASNSIDDSTTSIDVESTTAGDEGE